MDLKSHIGLRVKAARRRAGLTQEELAERLSKAVETISNIERGHTFTGLETLEKIGKALRTTVSYFFEGYRPERRVSRKRLELQQRVVEACEQLSDSQLSLAARLIEVVGKEGT